MKMLFGSTHTIHMSNPFITPFCPISFNKIPTAEPWARRTIDFDTELTIT